VVGLAVETSVAHGSVALFDGARILATRDWQRQQSHSEFVTPAIASLLRECGLATRDLKRLAVGLGPGSFTGVRVAVNVARALAFVHNLPVYAVDSHRILAEGAPRSELPLAVVTNAYKNSVFCSTYFWQGSSWREQLAPCAVPVASLPFTEPHLYLGDGLEAYGLRSEWLVPSGLLPYPQAQSLARLAELGAAPGRSLSWREVQPLYIRASSAEENKDKGMTKP
jgi:tRNA threonylcarbamoyladenosine biosynthesis protein TsaB